MKLDSQVSIQALVFALVASSFTVVYITQPVLPVLETEFGTDARTASLSVSAVIFAIALANLPFGALVDRYPIKPIILIGGSVIATASLIVQRPITSHSSSELASFKVYSFRRTRLASPPIWRGVCPPLVSTSSWDPMSRRPWPEA